MKALLFAIGGALAGVLSGCLIAGSAPAESPRSKPLAAVLQAAAAPSLPDAALTDKIETLKKSPRPLRSRIQMEQAVLRLTPAQARERLSDFPLDYSGRRQFDFASLLLGWRAAEHNPAAMWAAAGKGDTRGILRRWFTVNAKEAGAACSASGNYSLWAEVDPAACAAALPPSLVAKASRWFSTIDGADLFLEAWSSRAPQEAFAWVGSLGAANRGLPSPMGSYYRAVAVHDPRETFQEIWRQPPGRRVTTDMGDGRWSRWEGGPSSSWALASMEALSRHNAELGADIIKSLNIPPEMVVSYSPVYWMLNSVAKDHPEVCRRMAAQLPPGDLRDFAFGMAGYRDADTDPERAAEEVLAIKNPDNRSYIIRSFLYDILQQDPAMAVRLADRFTYSDFAMQSDDFARRLNLVSAELAGQWRDRMAVLKSEATAGGP